MFSRGNIWSGVCTIVQLPVQGNYFLTMFKCHRRQFDQGSRVARQMRKGKTQVFNATELAPESEKLAKESIALRVVSVTPHVVLCRQGLACKDDRQRALCP